MFSYQLVGWLVVYLAENRKVRLFGCNEPSFLAIFRKVHNQTTKPLFSNVVYLSADLRGDRVEGTKLLTLVAVKALYEGRDAVINLLS